MNGKVEGFKNDTILFNYQGNQLNFKKSDLISVYFNREDVSNDTGNVTKPAGINPSNAVRISGVVTYLSRFEFQPDAGTDVYVVECSNMKDFNPATLDSFNNFIVYKNYRKTWKERPTNQLLANIYDEGEKYDYDKASFKLLDKRAAMNISKIVNSKNVTKAVVDGSGNYSVKVRPGTYYVLFKSRNYTRLDKFETSEPFKCNIVNITEGEDVTMSYAFGFEYK